MDKKTRTTLGLEVPKSNDVELFVNNLREIEKAISDAKYAGRYVFGMSLNTKGRGLWKLTLLRVPRPRMVNQPPIDEKAAPSDAPSSQQTELFG